MELRRKAGLRVRNVLLAITVLCVLTPAAGHAAWLCGWTYRKPITVTEQVAVFE